MAEDRRPQLVMVVEDEAAIASMMAMQLQHSGYATHIERDGRAALEAIRRDSPDLVLLDIGLPGMDGIAVCRALRAEDNWTPVLFVTARDDEVDRIVGLELGADDYITKPFSPREVLARVASVLRRSGHAPHRQETEPLALRCGGVRCLPDQRQVFAGDDEVSLTATEFDLLAHLMGSPARVFTREQLLRQVWGYHSVAGQRTVDVHVAQVRSKLGAHDIIRTVRGVGYAAQPPRARNEGQ